MTQKPKIQYIGQFYVHGSEARALQEEQRKAKTRLPLARLEKIEKIYVDPVALVGIVVALVMLAVMVTGMLQIRDDWAQYKTMSSYVSSLKQTNAEKTRDYRAMYDLEDIRAKATAMGLVPKSEVEVQSVVITLPQPEPEMTLQEELRWYWDTLWE